MGMLMSTAMRTLGAASVVLATLQAEDAGRWQWKLREFTWVKREAAEKGAPPNAHPVTLSAEALARELGTVQFRNDKALEPLFAAEELARLAGPLQEAFALARPGEDLYLLSTDRRGGSFLNTSYGVAARLFVIDGTLNVIVQEARLDFLDRYRATGFLADFKYGSRSAAGRVELKAEGTLRRPDWLQIPLDRLQGSAPAPKAASAPVAERPAAAPDPSSAPKARDSRFFEDQEQRPRVLKRLRDENLITEEEYQRKRKEILGAL